MSKARLTKNGLLIPADWLKKIGDEVHVRRSRNTVLIESKARETARKQLTAMVRKLRKAGGEMGVLDNEIVSALVREVRADRARDH